jgi:tetratricopeptide (TPR) repeat protein
MYLRAIALRPNYWINHYEYGRFQLQMGGDLKAARTSLLKANQLHPAGYMPLVTLGLVELFSGDLVRAENYLRAAMKQEPNPFSSFNLGLVYYYRRNYDLALRNWRLTLDQVPENPVFQANIADALRQQGEAESARSYYAKAVKGFRSALQTNPEDDSSRAGMAMALAAMGSCEEAKEQTQKVLGHKSQSPETAAYAAVTASRCGDYKWASQIVLTSIAMDTLYVIRFDPDLEPVRKMPEVQRALERATKSLTTTSEPKS